MLHFLCRLCAGGSTGSTEWLHRHAGAGEWRGGAKHFICHWRTENQLPVRHQEGPSLCKQELCSLSRRVPVVETSCRLSNISCVYMHVCMCTCTAHAAGSKPWGLHTPTESQLCAFVLTLPQACCSNWLYSEHMTRAAPLLLYPVGLRWPQLASTA